MAKIIAPPAISNLDGLIDLLTNPQKYLDYMVQIKAMRDSILDMLGAFDTKEKADDYLANAMEKVNQANTALQRATAEEARIMNLCREKCAEADHMAEAACAKADAMEKQFAAREQALAKQASDLIVREQAVSARENQYKADREALSHREQGLKDELAKLKKTKELLAGIS